MEKYWFNPLYKLSEEKTIKALNKSWNFKKTPFSKSMIKVVQKNSEKIPIPKEILEKYSRWRPTPLRRVYDWERTLESSSPIYIKDEGASLLGSYKLNTAIAHAYYAKLDRYSGLVGETLAGHWGLALTYACNCFGLKCCIVIHESISEVKTGFAARIIDLGGEVQICQSQGDPLETSREMAIKLAEKRGWGYAVGCSFAHVLLHQSVIGMELLKQIKDSNIVPGALVACCGSGSNLGGMCLPVMEYCKKENWPSPKIFAAIKDPKENDAKVKAKGLTGHNLSTIIQEKIYNEEILLKEVTSHEAEAAGRAFFKSEGLFSAPETSYALAAVESITRNNTSGVERKPIIVCLSGRGYWDICVNGNGNQR